MRAHHFVPIVLAACLSACSLEPAYHQPPSGVGQAWPSGVAYAKPHEIPTSSRPAADIGWQAFFTDPQLRELIGIALKNNRNLRIAALSVKKAQALYRVQRGDLFPSIDASASETIEHVPGSVATAGPSSGGTFHTYSVGVGFASYVLDFFGRIRSLDHVALQQYFSQIATRKSAKISLVAELANDYLNYLSDRRLLKLSKNTYKNQKHALSLTQQSFKAGIVTSLDVSQAQQAVDTAQTDIARFTRRVAKDRNALRLVLGAPLPADLAQAAGLKTEHFLEALPAGLPSGLLARRPDILAAEHTLKASNANIGAARAAFFPSISLTGSFGTASNQLSGLFADGSQQWTFQPTISLPIFNGGANVANLDLAHVEKNIAVAQYQQTIQTAFREVADALAARGTLNQQITSQQQLTESAKKSYKLSLKRFRHGVANFLSVLDSQQSWYQARQTLITTRLARLQNLVTLYTALGGGWHAQTIKAAKDDVRTTGLNDSKKDKLAADS
jgi:multidrug efflux system outer membrane protein